MLQKEKKVCIESETTVEQEKRWSLKQHRKLSKHTAMSRPKILKKISEKKQPTKKPTIIEKTNAKTDIEQASGNKETATTIEAKR